MQQSTKPYAPAARIAYLGDALAAVRGLGTAGRLALDDELQAGARSRCRAAYGPPPQPCLLELARATCEARSASAARAACALAADVLVVNLLGENALVDEATRVRLVNQSADYRAALRVELTARRALLAAELVLAEPGGDDATLPARIDHLCSRREREPAWQRCAAALIWYIGDHPEEPTP